MKKRLGIISTMGRRKRDQAEISETAKWAELKLSNCQVGNGKRPSRGLAYYQKGSVEGSYFQVGNEMISGDLIDYHVVSRKFPIF
jgi:hypothetical protein